MALAARSGQPFLDLLDWHPRDVDTLVALYEAEVAAAREEARNERFAAMREELARRMGRR